ncbi:hypothetical protein ABZ694_30930 [Streptomyces albidoflavus]|uniref:hypothetical protein n=1 Tax=Streptomyces albidoflavus TaxID=1886 RepID=UPI0033C86D75
MSRLTTERLALFGTLLATFGELYSACDHWVQGSTTAKRKRLYGGDLVHADGSSATPDSTRRTMTTSSLGRRAVACHVASLGAAPSASPDSAMIAQFSGMRLWTVGARQVSQNEAVAA